MAANRTINVGDKAFSVRLGWNAVRRIEEVLHEPVQAIGLRMVLGQAGLRELGTVFWAGLETARIKDKSRPQPYTLEEVGDIIDEMDADVFFEQVYPQLIEAITEAFPTVKKAAADKKGSGTGDPPPAAPAGTGTAS